MPLKADDWNAYIPTDVTKSGKTNEPVKFDAAKAFLPIDSKCGGNVKLPPKKKEP